MEEGLADLRRTIGGQYMIALLAKNYSRMDRTEEALKIVNEALAEIERTGATVYKAEMLRLKGDMLLIQGGESTDNAEHCFRGALEVARAQEAKCWELRATVSLARLLDDTNRSDEARAMLSEVYNWFTEGFDLADLKEAKALLGELSS